jgi:tRNA (guanine9-N1)-methyltransferase
MVSQLSYVYSCNRTAAKPVSAILHTSFSAESSPRLHGKMEKANWEKWTRSHWSPEGLDGIVKAERARSEAQPEASNSGSPSVVLPLSTSAPSGSSTPAPNPDSLPWPPRRIVYLSADAEDELTTLSPDDVYVIGGIVDRNRHKVSDHSEQC